MEETCIHIQLFFIKEQNGISEYRANKQKSLSMANAKICESAKQRIFEETKKSAKRILKTNEKKYNQSRLCKQTKKMIVDFSTVTNAKL